MNSVSMDVEPMIGNSIRDVDDDMIRLAYQLNITITSKFNGVSLVAFSGMNYGDIEKQYRESFGGEG